MNYQKASSGVLEVITLSTSHKVKSRPGGQAQTAESVPAHHQVKGRQWEPRQSRVRTVKYRKVDTTHILANKHWLHNHNGAHHHRVLTRATNITVRLGVRESISGQINNLLKGEW